VQAKVELSRRHGEGPQYFEVHIKELAKGACIGIGLAPKKFSLKGQFPGWKNQYILLLFYCLFPFDCSHIFITQYLWLSW
jgi:hypothetical protein